MLTITQYEILNACCNDVELFYFLFAEVNYGGQLFVREPGDTYRLHVDDKDWIIKVQAQDLIPEIVSLINEEFIDCWEIDRVGKWRKRTDVSVEDFVVYDNYNCKTFDEHLERYDYGPHEFRATEKGTEEIAREEYRPYDQQIGYGV